MKSSPSILIVDDNPIDLMNVVLEARKRFSSDIVEARSIEEARRLIRSQKFDIIFFGHHSLEDGVQIYIDILNDGYFACQFILFTANPSQLGPAFARHFKMVSKPDASRLVGAAVWPLSSGEGGI